MPLLRGIRTKWGAFLRKWMLYFRLPDYIYYINGPETLPPPLSREEEKLVFEGLEAGDPQMLKAAAYSSYIFAFRSCFRIFFYDTFQPFWRVFFRDCSAIVFLRT